jgi:lysyl-tRNA synthetase class 2
VGVDAGTESHLVRERRAKLERLRARGVEPFPWEFRERVPSAEVVARCRALASGEADERTTVRVAGRLRAIREHGKSAFADLEDRAGAIQLLLRVDELGDAGYRQWLADLDPGDLVGASGVPLVTRRGEPSVRVHELTLLAKALEPPPEKYHGLQDAEARLRRRYVDLLASPESRQRFVARSLLVREMRRFFDDLDFLEVETPILVPVASGAAAAPFVTRSRYLDSALQLRISIELYLKRLIVGGLERVYEIGRIFRNEDMDVVHAPEFTMLELYWAYADYFDMRDLIERLYERLAGRAAEILPESAAAREAPELFRRPFAQVDYVEELERRSGLNGLLERDPEEIRRLARATGATIPEESPIGKFWDKLFEHYVEPHLTRPTFVLDFPTATTPLAKRHRTKPGRVERFELFWRGVELGNAYTELNDPDEQERRFREQLSQRGEDSYAYDEDFVRALRSGMPPTAGVGIGVDRAIMALTGTASIKDILLFAPTRPRPGAE